MTCVDLCYVTVAKDGHRLRYQKIFGKEYPSVEIEVNKDPDAVYDWFHHEFGLGMVYFDKRYANVGAVALELIIEKDWSQEEIHEMFEEAVESGEADPDEMDEIDYEEDLLSEFADDPYYHYHFFDPNRALARAVKNEDWNKIKEMIEKDQYFSDEE